MDIGNLDLEGFFSINWHIEWKVEKSILAKKLRKLMTGKEKKDRVTFLFHNEIGRVGLLDLLRMFFPKSANIVQLDRL